MANILILYSTTDGHTRKICDRLQQIAQGHGHKVTSLSVNDQADISLAEFDKIVVGASIRYGKHSPQVYDFIRTNAAILESLPNAFFTVNVVARKADKNTPESNPYLKKFLKQIPWCPNELGVFAGKIDYQMYGFWDRQMIRFIMRITNGPTDLNTPVDFTDWDKVTDFGRRISAI